MSRFTVSVVNSVEREYRVKDNKYGTQTIVAMGRIGEGPYCGICDAHYCEHITAVKDYLVNEIDGLEFKGYLEQRFPVALTK